MNNNLCAVRNGKSNPKKYSPTIRRKSPNMSPQFSVPWHNRGASNFDLGGFFDQGRLLSEQERHADLIERQHREGQGIAQQLASLQVIINQQKITLDAHHEEAQNRHDSINERIEELEAFPAQEVEAQQEAHKVLLCELVAYNRITSATMNKITGTLNAVVIKQRELAELIGKHREHMHQLAVNGDHIIKQNHKKQEEIDKKMACLSRDLDRHDKEEVQTRLISTARIARLERVQGGLEEKIRVLQEHYGEEEPPEEKSMSEVRKAQMREVYAQSASEHSSFVSNLLKNS